ncbi:MAG: methyltransferase domain-containing protein [Promethearchaeota archaeon]
MKLNLGCGRDIRKGWINLDIIEKEGVDVIHDLNKLPLPFEDEKFDDVLCKDVLEHVDYLPLINDIHRILKKGGRLLIKVPHFTSKSSYGDPTHINLFSTRSFYYFVNQDMFTYDIAVKQFSKIKVRILFEGFEISIFRIINKILENWVNKSVRRQRFYERSFLRIFPAFCILVVLRK